jgi:hypothetical protein
MGILMRLKHWQLFFLTFGLFAAAFIALSIIDLGEIFNDGLLIRMIFFVQTLCLVTANFWLFAVGTRLHKKYYYNSFMMLIFRLAIYFSTFYQISRIVIFPSVPYFDNGLGMLGLVISVGGTIYCTYFAAQLLTSVEKQRDTAFSEFIGDFLLFIFYPIGVWWLQPRINKIFDRDHSSFDPDAPLDQHVTN